MVGLPILLTAIFCFALVLSHPASQGVTARTSANIGSDKPDASITPENHPKKPIAHKAGKAPTASDKTGVNVVPGDGYGQYGQQAHTGAPQTGSPVNDLQSADSYDGNSSIIPSTTDGAKKATHDAANDIKKTAGVR